MTFPKTIIIWYNPGSTNARRTLRLIEQLHEQFPATTLEVVRTEKGSYDENQKRLQTVIEEHTEPTWLIVGGGDGTISSALNVLREIKRDIPIVPFAAGNSNDVASILHGRLHRAFPARRLRKAKSLPVTPLICTITTADGTKTVKYGITYVSFGITAHTARSINAPSHRDVHATRTTNRLKRRVHEIQTFIRILNEADAFTIEENGQDRELYERIFVNGQRMAKYFRWPVLLTESAFHDVQIDSLKPKDNMQNMRKMASGHLYGTRFEAEDAIGFTAKSAVVGQLDGETIHIAAGTHVAVELAKTPSTFISIR